MQNEQEKPVNSMVTQEIIITVNIVVKRNEDVKQIKKYFSDLGIDFKFFYVYEEQDK